MLRQMPEVQQLHQAAVRRADTYDGTLAVCTVGTRHYEPLFYSSQAVKILGRRHRLLHQVGRGGSFSHHYGEKYPKFCLEKHYMQVRDTQGTGL